jgi:hypothetical protein
MLLPARIFIYGRGNSIGWFEIIVKTIGDNNNKNSRNPLNVYLQFLPLTIIQYKM